jgi:hypothetical protein
MKPRLSVLVERGRGGGAVTQLGVTYLVYLGLTVPLVLAASWTLYRYGAMLLVDALDADEMLAAAVARIVTVGFALFSFGLAAALLPSASTVRFDGNVVAAALSAVAGVLVLEGVGLLALVGAFALARTRRLRRDLPRLVAPPPFPIMPPPVPPVPPVPPPAFGPPPWGPPGPR